MKFIYHISLMIFSILSFHSLKGQDVPVKKFYTTTGGEIIFSWADVKVGDLNADVITRFSPVLNLQFQFHRDFSTSFGFHSGINVRNVGFIFDDPTTVNTRYKARTYTLGVPVALKAGNMNRFFVFGGYEIEFPFNYKEKKFVNEDKEDKTSSWFSDKVPSIYHSFFAGFQTPFGTQIKFKYYITNFFNKSYAASDDSGNLYHPYEGIEANVFYVSLSWQLLQGTEIYYKKESAK